jgi:hypothetical protein
MANKVIIKDFPDHRTFIAFVSGEKGRQECARFSYDFGKVKAKVKEAATAYCNEIKTITLEPYKK